MRNEQPGFGKLRNTQSAMTVMIAAGGTGGHIYPGLAIAKEFVRRNPRTQIVFVGTARGLEKRLIPTEGFRLEILKTGALKNVGFARQFAALLRMPADFMNVFELLRAYRPCVVIGAGGFVTGPVVLSAALARVPTMIVEPNALPGLTNRLLAMFVRRAAVSFRESLRFFRGKGVVTGTPVRGDFFDLAPREPSEQMELLIFGGSQGAHAINEAMIGALAYLESLKGRLSVIHQTGEADHARVLEAYAQSRLTADVRPYIDRIVEAFRLADLVICRAGAMTTAEIAAAGRAAILIPFPLAADDHQRKNAEAMMRAGASQMILQSELSGERLAREVLHLLNDPDKRAEMGRAARTLAHPDAAGKVVDLAMELIGTPAVISAA